MSILDYIENLRQKPEFYRQRIAFSVTLFITLVIFVGWAFSLWLSTNDYHLPETVTGGLTEVKNTTNEGLKRISVGTRVVKTQIENIIHLIFSNNQ
jgi:hypothetical protein